MAELLAQLVSGQPLANIAADANPAKLCPEVSG